MYIEYWLKYLLIPALAMAITYLLTPRVMRLAEAIGMVDQPGARRLHLLTVPLGGGLAVFAGFHIGCVAVFLLPLGGFRGTLTLDIWLKIFILTSITLAIGLWDDRFGMRAVVKLLGQMAVGVLAYLLGISIDSFYGWILPVWINLPGTVLWFVVFINAFNLIDGMDGLATGLAAIAAFGLAGVLLLNRNTVDCLVMLALAGACLAFLRYNFHPASVFLGDTGSMFLGCVLAALSLGTGFKSPTLAALAAPLLAVGIPLFDTFLAVWRRIARKFLGRQKEDGGAVFGADMDHLHHRLLKKGYSQRRVATLLYGASIVLVSAGLLAVLFQSQAQGIFLIVFVTAVYISVRHIAQLEMWTTGVALMQGFTRPRLTNLTVPLYIVFDIFVLEGAHLVASILLNPEPATWNGARDVLLSQTPLYTGIPFLCLALGGRIYKRVWHLARATDFAVLVLWTVMGILFAAGLSLALGIESDPSSTVFKAALYIGLAVVPLLVLHSFMRLTADSLAIMQLRGTRGSARISVLVYGAGDHGLLFMRDEEAQALQDGSRLHIAGFLDDKANLHGRMVCGLPVFGGHESIRKALKKTAAKLVVVTTELSAVAREELHELAAKRVIMLREWRPVLKEMKIGNYSVKNIK